MGGFLSYGRASNSSDRENYKVAMVGLEAIHNVNNDFTIFGQLAYGDSIDNPDNSNQSSYGFHHGKVLRAGVVYSGFSRTSVSLEFEYGKSSAYEDGDEPGRFSSIYLGGQTAITSDGRWVGTYGIRSSRFDAKNDPDEVKETTVNIGVRYTFGASKPINMARAGIIGLPYTPLRASAWTPSLD